MVTPPSALARNASGSNLALDFFATTKSPCAPASRIALSPTSPGFAPDLDHVYSAAITPIASVQGELAFFGLRRAPISAPSTARSFHAWPNGLPRIRPLLSDRPAAALAFS